jgi:hypothetical protein
MPYHAVLGPGKGREADSDEKHDAGFWRDKPHYLSWLCTCLSLSETSRVEVNKLEDNHYESSNSLPLRKGWTWTRTRFTNG